MRRITNSSISIMGGICFILFAAVCIFSSNTPFAFLYKAITDSLGFIGFWLILPYIVSLGLYLILYKRIIKFRVGVRLWGVLLILVCFIILTSHWATIGTEINGVKIIGYGRNEEGLPQYLTFSNSIDVFKSVSDANPSVVTPNPKLGGGEVGYILAGALNSAITPTGLHIVCWSLFAGGILMVFNTQVFRLFNIITGRTPIHIFPKKERVVEEIETPSSLEVESDKNEEIIENKPLFETFHTSTPIINNDQSLKKAKFAFLDEDAPEMISEEMTKATFEPTLAPSYEPNEEEVEGKVEEEYSEPFFEPLADKQNEQVASSKEESPLEVSKLDESEFEEEEVVKPAPQPKINIIKNYIYPNIDLLNEASNDGKAEQNEASCEERTETMNKVLEDFKIGAKIVSHTVGPSVTRFDLQTNPNVSVQTVQRYVTDLSVRLGGVPMRFEPIVSGKSTSGIEIPNAVRVNVSLREAVEGLPKEVKHRLDVPFGKSISGDLVYANLADFPHLLVAGTTGSGKSIFVHSTIISLLMRNKPDELKLVMIDPKKVEMTYYEDIPHLLCPVISDMRKAKVCFDKLVIEMDNRYEIFRQSRTRDIKGYNEYAKSKGLNTIPYIVVFIDEYADLIETNKEIREPVVRIVQKARAAGIHLCLATQRPSVNVVDGVIKANVSTRVALMCASYQDSMTVISEGGAEKLLGNGDMLIECPLISRSIKPRVQGCYVSETEIQRVCDFLREHYQPQFDPTFLNLEPVVEEKSFEEPQVVKFDKEKTDEEVYQRIKEDATHREYFSISHITRTYQMGYSRAGKMFIRLQKEGIVAMSGDARGCKVLAYVGPSQQAGTVEQSTVIPDDGTSY